jgi:hypothetical protein
MDEFIAQVADNHRKAGMLGIAWKVEQTVQHLGLMDYFVDANGDGPFMQAVKEN